MYLFTRLTDEIYCRRFMSLLLFSCDVFRALISIVCFVRLYSSYRSPVLRQTHACSNSNAQTAEPMAFALSHTSATSGIIFPKTPGYTLLLSFPTKETEDISLLRIFQLHLPLSTRETKATMERITNTTGARQ